MSESRHDAWTRPSPTVTVVLVRSALVLLGFNALSAIGGAIGMLTPGGMGMPATMLDGTAFPSFAAPAVILLLVIGGTQVIALYLALRHRASAIAWLAVAGFGLVIWIFVEVAMIGFGALQAVYFVSGLAELCLAFALLGIVRWIPALPR